MRGDWLFIIGGVALGLMAAVLKDMDWLPTTRLFITMVGTAILLVVALIDNDNDSEE